MNDETPTEDEMFDQAELELGKERVDHRRFSLINFSPSLVLGFRNNFG